MTDGRAEVAFASELALDALVGAISLVVADFSAVVTFASIGGLVRAVTSEVALFMAAGWRLAEGAVHM